MINHYVHEKSKVLVNSLDVKAEPSINMETITQYNVDMIINTGGLLIENKGRTWLRYTGS